MRVLYTNMSKLRALKDVIIKYYGHTVMPGVMGRELYNNTPWGSRGMRIVLGVSSELSRLVSAAFPILAYAGSHDAAATLPFVELAIKNYFIMTAGLLPAVNIFARLGKGLAAPGGVGVGLEHKV